MFDTLPSYPWLPPLMTGSELAEAMRYSGVTSAFRGWLKSLDIKPVPGRSDLYDPHHVRHRLNEAQGLSLRGFTPPEAPTENNEPRSLTEMRRQRRGK
ncbi:hypothetical protein [Alloyangia pacifica]|uniref:Uncharacterized protein n=1 Tax=Alloyangia pacifica TaxID=311180 RepID=A0A1I6RJY1_9RHOB|nr:hypothetical protein [Alloyangia pacifica]SDG52488.1 hypothetical protein SAMN04488245_103142 [Alloyangia pacifica]SFS64956.1 hypothetical protein SAMN04488050_103142 [Alloyangia pacifica]